MKRILLSLMLLAGISMSFLLISDTPVVGGATFSNRDLSGEYIFSIVEIRTELVGSPPIAVTNYCDHSGMATFDGIGMVTVNDTERCNVTGNSTTTFTQNYSVNPDGSFLIPDNANPLDIVHGQILAHGRSLLVDGTTRTNPNVLIFHGVAMQR